jgi:tetratricopeptide (TPR) repeat protein
MMKRAFLVACALRTLSILTTVSMICAAPLHASADEKRDAEARALFQAGREAFDGGRYEAALARWQEAYDLSARATLLYNLGLAHDRLRQDDHALSAFKAYLTQVPQAENREEVEGRIRALEAAQREREKTAAPAPVVVPTAEETARQAPSKPAHEAASPPPKPIPHDDTPVTARWWFWTGIGAVVVGGVIVGIAAASGGERQAAPIESRTGVEIMALTSSR